MENAPSVEKIFAVVTTEIKPNTTGKYFVQIDDNWRMQSIRENFVTLEDAVKIARIMHSELRKVSRLIYATIKARTVEEVTGDIGRRCEDYGIYHSTAKVEVENTKLAAEKNNPLQEKIAGLRTAEKIIAKKYLNLCAGICM